MISQCATSIGWTMMSDLDLEDMRVAPWRPWAVAPWIPSPWAVAPWKIKSGTWPLKIKNLNHRGFSSGDVLSHPLLYVSRGPGSTILTIGHCQKISKTLLLSEFWLWSKVKTLTARVWKTCCISIGPFSKRPTFCFPRYLSHSACFPPHNRASTSKSPLRSKMLI